MAVKTFTDNTSLPASDINTYLNNGGLVYIKSQTVGTAVASVTVSGAFSADFDNYRVIYMNGVGSGIAILTLTLGSTATGYYQAGISVPYAGATVLNQVSNGAAWAPIGVMGTDYTNVTFEMYSPFLSRKTFGAWDYLYVNEYIRIGGYLNNTTSYTAFTITTGAGTLTGGTITVYGYRKA